VSGTTITLANPGDGAWTAPLVSATDTLMIFPRWHGIVMVGAEHNVEHIYTANVCHSAFVFSDGNQAGVANTGASQENHLTNNKPIWPSYNPPCVFNLHQHGVWVQKLSTHGVTDSFITELIPSRMTDTAMQMDSGGDWVLSRNHPWAINGRAAVRWRSMGGSSMVSTVVDDTGNAQAATTVGADSNGGDLSQVATWTSPAAGILHVASAAPGGNPLHQAGIVAVNYTGTSYAWIEYTGLGVDSSGHPALLGCTYLNCIPQNSGSAAVATGAAVSQVYASVQIDQLTAPPAQQPSVIELTKHHPSSSGTGTLVGLLLLGSTALAELTLANNRWSEDTGFTAANDYTYVLAGSTSGCIINRTGEINRCSTSEPQILSGAVSLSAGIVALTANTPTTVAACAITSAAGSGSSWTATATTTTANGLAACYIGQTVTGTGIPTGATVATLNSTTSIGLAAATTFTNEAGPETLTFTITVGTNNWILTTPILTPGDYMIGAGCVIEGTTNTSAVDLFVGGHGGSGATVDTTLGKLGATLKTGTSSTQPNPANFAGRITVTAEGTVSLGVYPSSGLTGTTQFLAAGSAGSSNLAATYLSWARAS
jgi:hypothetical protein